MRCTVRFAAPSSSHLHFESLLSLLGSLRKPLKTKFRPAVSSVYSLSLSLSLSLSPREHTREKNPVRSARLIQAKLREASGPSLFFLSPDFAFNMRKSNCAGRGQRRCHGCRIHSENEARGSSADQPSPADITECCHQVPRAHTAGSG